MALTFVAEGAFITVNDLKPADIETTIMQVEDCGGEAFSEPCDVTELQAVYDMVRKVEAKYGRIDILISNDAVRMTSEPFLETNPKIAARKSR